MLTINIKDMFNCIEFQRNRKKRDPPRCSYISKRSVQLPIKQEINKINRTSIKSKKEQPQINICLSEDHQIVIDCKDITNEIAFISQQEQYNARTHFLSFLNRSYFDTDSMYEYHAMTFTTAEQLVLDIFSKQIGLEKTKFDKEARKRLQKLESLIFPKNKSLKYHKLSSTSSLNLNLYEIDPQLLDHLVGDIKD
ncbi:hypothetical protein QTN25_005843 [Entamoeba marina]